MIEITIKGTDLKDLVKNINSLLTDLGGNKVTATTSPKQTIEKAVVNTTATTPKAPVKKATATTPKAPTHADVRTVLQPLLENNRAKVVELLKKYNALNVTALPDDKLSDFIKDAKAIKG